MAALGLATSTASALPGAVLCGLGWITVLTSLNVSAQTALPNWVRARGLAISLMVFFGCMAAGRSEEHTSELQSLMRISYAVFCLKKKKNNYTKHQINSN